MNSGHLIFLTLYTKNRIDIFSSYGKGMDMLCKSYSSQVCESLQRIRWELDNFIFLTSTMPEGTYADFGIDVSVI